MTVITSVHNQDVVIEPLIRPDPSFLAFTFPTHRSLWLAGTSGVVAVGAIVDGIAIGLALGQEVGHMDEAGGPTARLLSLMVASPYRRRGIGGALLRRLEEVFAAHGVVGIFATHSTRLPARTAFEQTLAVAGWHPPQFYEQRFRAECGKMIPAGVAWPAMEGRLLRDKRYSFTPWCERDVENDRAALEQLCRQPVCARAPHIHPDNWERIFDPAISLAVRRDGSLVGWVLAQRLELPYRPSTAPAEIYYVSYLDEGLQRSGIMVAVYFRAFQRQAAAYGDESVALYSAVVPAMIATTLRRFAPISGWADEIHLSKKQLTLKPTLDPAEDSTGALRGQ